MVEKKEDIADLPLEPFRLFNKYTNFFEYF